jgi:hypothetical protein
MQTNTSAEKLTRLVDFRQYIYTDCFLRARDALFELCDAAIVTRAINSFAELSLCRLFRRRWPSLYESLNDGVIDAEASLSCVLAEMVHHQPSSLSSSPSSPIVLAIDHTSYPREQSYTLAERGYWHHPTAVPGNRPITIGYGFSTIAWIPDTQQIDSWCLPLLHERIVPESAPLATAAEQLQRVLTRLGPEAERVVLLGDSEYGSAPFLAATAGRPCTILCRLRPNRVLYQPPPDYSGFGRRRIHGAKFHLKQSETWTPPVEQQQLTDPKLGVIRLRRWSALHFQATASQPMDVLLVEQLTVDGKPKQTMWLLSIASASQPVPAMTELWRLYLRRYCIDHWYRFAKQRLHANEPKLSSPERIDRWNALLVLASWQLYLGRDLVEDSPLPWQKPQLKPTPERVANSFATLLAGIATPAIPPKPRGKSPGWPQGRKRHRREQHTIVRKTTRRWSSTPKSPP